MLDYEHCRECTDVGGWVDKEGSPEDWGTVKNA